MEGNSTSPPNPVPGESSPGAPSSEERFTAQLAWGLNILFPVIGPYLMWKLQAKDSAFVAHHAKVGSNHVLTVMVLSLVACVVLAGPAYPLLYAFEPTTELEIWLPLIAVFILVGLLLLVLVVLGLATLIVHLVAVLKAGRGEWYVPPLCWRFTK